MQNGIINKPNIDVIASQSFCLHSVLTWPPSSIPTEVLVLNKINVKLTVYKLVDLFKDDDDGERNMFDVHGYEHKVMQTIINSEYLLVFNGT